MFPSLNSCNNLKGLGDPQNSPNYLENDLGAAKKSNSVLEEVEFSRDLHLFKKSSSPSITKNEMGEKIDTTSQVFKQYILKLHKQYADRISEDCKLSQRTAAALQIVTEKATSDALDYARQSAMIAFELSESNKSIALDRERKLLRELVNIQNQQIEDIKIANETQQSFLRYIFHELRNPLNSICLGVELLSRDALSMSQEGQDSAALLSVAAHAMKELLDNTLDHTNMKNLALQVILAPAFLSDIVHAVVGVMLPLAENCATTIEWRISPRLNRQIMIDSHALRQILTNILSNAIKFSPNDGTGSVMLEISTTDDLSWDTSGTYPSTPQSEAQLSQTNLENVFWSLDYSLESESLDDSENQSLTLLIAVKDNGKGIPDAAQIQSMFEPRRRLSRGVLQCEQGSGIGLSIVRDLVKLLEGNVGVVKDQIDQGAVFVVKLRAELCLEAEPNDPPPPAPSLLPISPQIELLDTLHILIVDDVASIRKLLRRLLHNRFSDMFKQGSSVVILDVTIHIESIEFEEADNGDTALEAVFGLRVDGSIDSSRVMKRFHAITMDAMMPVMDGFSCTKLLRDRGYAGGIFGCSGNSVPADLELFLVNGADMVFVKPIDTSGLLYALLEKCVQTWKTEMNYCGH